jgi:hypothetical protein
VEYSAKEVQARFRAALRAFNTPPKPLKSMTRKGDPAQAKKASS